VLIVPLTSPELNRADSIRARDFDIERQRGDNRIPLIGGFVVTHELDRLWSDEQGQDIAEYAVMLAVILVLVVGTIRLVGSNANNAFSSVASSIQ